MQLMNNLQKRLGGLSGLVKDGEWCGNENLPRFLRGITLLACALDDKNLKDRAKSYVMPILSSANEGGDFGSKESRSLTPKIEAVKALLTYYEATGNERILPFLKKYFKSQFNTSSMWADWYDSRARLLDEIQAIETVYRETDLEWLQDLGEQLRAESNDWFKLASRFVYKKPYNKYISQSALKRINKMVLTYDCVNQTSKRQKPYTREFAESHWRKSAHQVAVETSGVNLAKAVKYPATYGRFIGDDALKNLSLKMISALEKYHGTPLGAFACDPRLASGKGVRGIDVQAAVEYLESLIEVVRETRDYHAMDIVERIIFNLVPGACFEDGTAVQDTILVNQVEASCARKLPYSDCDNAFYTRKLSKGAIAVLSAYPLYMQTACMVKDEELNFLTYTPCVIDVSAGGTTLSISERTGYPFRNTVVFKVEQASGEQEVKINFRVPKNTTMQLISGGQVVATGSREISVKCILKTGSTFMLKMSIPLVAEDNSDDTKSLYKGNLLMSLKLPYETSQNAVDRRILSVKSVKKWNVSPIFARKSGAKALSEEETTVVNDFTDKPFNFVSPPFELKIRSKTVFNWDYDVNGFTQIPKKCSYSEECLERTYQPFGATLLHVAKFPKCLK